VPYVRMLRYGTLRYVMLRYVRVENTHKPRRDFSVTRGWQLATGDECN